MSGSRLDYERAEADDVHLYTLQATLSVDNPIALDARPQRMSNVRHAIMVGE